MFIRRYRIRKCLVILLLFILLAGLHWTLDIMKCLSTHDSEDVYLTLEGIKYEGVDLKTRASIIKYVETNLEEALKEDKGTGCVFPKLDPFSKEVTQFEKPVSSVQCRGKDWVKCYLSECRVNKTILREFKYIDCTYRDIIYINDHNYTIGKPTTVKGGGVYTLTKSDHVKVRCVGRFFSDFLPKKWIGHVTGFRKNVERVKPPPGREDSIDVLIFGFDSTARNGFIRRMPKSWEYLNKELEATVLYGMNIMGDATKAAQIPLLTGKTELELPDVRKISNYTDSLDDIPFIFYKLKADGYRTAYFEDMPWIGTFQRRFKGFQRQPTDHYLRAFYQEENSNSKTNRGHSRTPYCVGDTLQYKLMMNITEQFLELDGKHFAFTFIVDISHDDFNMISIADADTRDFLKALKESGKLERTLLIVMGDHGPRYANVRKTLQGKFEERMPLMAIRLPEVLTKKRPEISAILKNNSEVLTTFHDIYATILDAMGLKKHWNNYKIKGADLTRGLTLFEPIPRNRSCSEAGVEPHWCVCVAWDRVDPTDLIANKVATAFVGYINQLTESVRSQCSLRTLTNTPWVNRRRAKKRMLQFHKGDDDGILGFFTDSFKHDKEYYQIKVEVGPESGMFEASATYLKEQDKFIFNSRDISRINAYNDQPACISETHPHLNMYCYCHSNDQVHSWT